MACDKALTNYEEEKWQVTDDDFLDHISVLHNALLHGYLNP